MACEQRLRVKQGSVQMLPRAVATEQQSLVVVKKLLAIAVSSITYLRGLFPEKAYGSKYVEEQKVMILREERSCPGASQIVQWSVFGNLPETEKYRYKNSCKDALMLYKRDTALHVFFQIYSDPEYPEKITECYQFRIQYTAKGPQLNFESIVSDIASKNQKHVTKMDSNDIKKASILLVRKLYTLMQNLGPLPDSVCLNMKLSYCDEVTPQDYQPPGFKEGDSNMLVDDDEPVCARDRWALKINEKEFVSVSEILPEFSTKDVVIDTGIENPDLSKEEMQENSQFQVDSLVKKTADLEVAAMKTRSARLLKSSDRNAVAVARPTNKKPISQFEFPLSQDPQPPASKRRKFSVPKESN
ncbi:hypothetical protein P4O66_010371 [Electrophorus voltai]|uniref:HORMA domain-containing protein n=1 Tax=Electrophorus voltai TaxID=2609070 RepID=A0AAD8Z9R6_9TELE|nr:hypothetical protein P4O66_010371 [Electrophorus voltai]